MHEQNELIVIELSPEGRMRLSNQIYHRMEELRFIPFRYDDMDLGFHLPAEWPDDPTAEITMAQLVVLANKLKMRLAIGDINFSPMSVAADPKPNTKD